MITAGHYSNKATSIIAIIEGQSYPLRELVKVNNNRADFAILAIDQPVNFKNYIPIGTDLKPYEKAIFAGYPDNGPKVILRNATVREDARWANCYYIHNGDSGGPIGNNALQGIVNAYSKRPGERHIAHLTPISEITPYLEKLFPDTDYVPPPLKGPSNRHRENILRKSNIDILSQLRDIQKRIDSDTYELTKRLDTLSKKPKIIYKDRIVYKDRITYKDKDRIVYKDRILTDKEKETLVLQMIKGGKLDGLKGSVTLRIKATTN